MQILSTPPPKKNQHCLLTPWQHSCTYTISFTRYDFIHKKAVYMNIVSASVSFLYRIYHTMSPIIGIFFGRFVGLLLQSTYVDLMPTEAQRTPIAGWWRTAPIDRVLLTKCQTQNWYRQAKCQHQKSHHYRKLYKQLLDWLKCNRWQQTFTI